MTQLLDWTRKNKVVNQPKVSKVKHKPMKENRRCGRVQKKNEKNQQPWAFDEGEDEDGHKDDESRTGKRIEKKREPREVRENLNEDESEECEAHLQETIEEERGRREVREDEKEDEEGDVDCEARLQNIVDLMPCSFPLDHDEDDDTDLGLIDDDADPEWLTGGFLLFLGILLIWFSGYSSSISLTSTIR